MELEMEKEFFVSEDERRLAALAHGSILLGVFTSGVGGIFAAMIIWLTQREKSTYVARQSLQAMVYQTTVLFLSVIAFCLWGALFFSMMMAPMMANPELYQNTPPPSMWFGMTMLICPCGLWLTTILYGIWGAIRCLSGSDFDYIIIGRWLGESSNP
jgi:uncharacterized Tic20 family protein